MCGIYFLYRGRQHIKEGNHSILTRRGPDDKSITQKDNYVAAFYRLAIVGLDRGMQPFETKELLLMCNGEIYNHQLLEIKYSLSCKSGSDCECIMQLYSKIGIDRTIRELDGEFAFVLYDKVRNLIFFARDRLGRKPLYMGMIVNDTKVDAIEIASMYGALAMPLKIQAVPGKLHIYDINERVLAISDYHHFTYEPGTISIATLRNAQNELSTLEIDKYNYQVSNKEIYDCFVEAVSKRVTQSERPVGFLLSGGFDSSVVLSIALKHDMLIKPPHVFTIGFDENAPDVKSAGVMVDWLRSKYGPDCIIWHRVILPIEAGLNAIEEVIEALETYDTTTIRASTPMYLISKYISENTNVKVVLSGEGSDELFGGYLYFRYAPNDYAFRSEICDLLTGLYLYDVLRADRTTAHWGLEVRPPFLDDAFVSMILSCDRLCMSKTTTKSLIREVMMSADVLPESILLGKKEAFSDAVGLSWKDDIAKYTEVKIKELVTDEHEYSHTIIPETAEARMFQRIFGKKFPDSWHLLPSLWLPNQMWVKTGSEPSARVLDVYGVDGGNVSSTEISEISRV
jgi:asparagine synthase (glutamine-hydrolysing)